MILSGGCATRCHNHAFSFQKGCGSVQPHHQIVAKYRPFFTFTRFTKTCNNPAFGAKDTIFKKRQFINIKGELMIYQPQK
jgi:hypothetical protein